MGKICEENELLNNLGNIFKEFLGVKALVKDVQTTCNITKLQAKHGIIKPMKVSVADVCEESSKTLSYRISDDNKFMFKEKDIVVRIPPNVKKLDTYAMVKIWEKFKEVVKNG